MRTPFLVSTGELFRHRGARSHIELVGPLHGVELSTSRLTGGDVHADLVFEAQGSAITVTGTVTAPWEGQCRRCLNTTRGDMQIELREVFEPHPVEGETYPLGRDSVNLEPVLREALALALPLAPLCSEDCPGPDPEAHPVVPETTELDATDAGEASEPAADPRWAALDELRFDR